MIRIGKGRPETAISAPRLEVRDLRVVLALAHAGTTAAAASVLHLTQSAVSRALTTAEEHAGAALFTRTPKGLVPTDAGLMVLGAAPELLAGLVDLEHRLRAPCPRPRTVRLVAECHMAYAWLTDFVVRLKRHAPAIRVSMPVEHSGRAAEALAEGKVDAAMIVTHTPEGHLSQPLFDDELLFLVGRDHALGKRAALLPRDLVEHSLLVPSSTAHDALFMRAVFGSRRPRLRVDRVPVTEAIVELARVGLGIGVLSEWLVGSYVDKERDLRVLRLRKGPIRRAWRLAYHPSLAPVVPLLIDGIVGAQPATTRHL